MFQSRQEQPLLYMAPLSFFLPLLSILFQVLLGDADYFNATLYGVYLVFSYGSQLILAYAALQGTLGFTGSSLLGSNDPFNSGSSSSSSDGSSSDDDDVGASRVVLAVMCCAEAFLAVGLAISARCGLGTTLWSRVRVTFKRL
jgi:hypothetical protein